MDLFQFNIEFEEETIGIFVTNVRSIRKADEKERQREDNDEKSCCSGLPYTTHSIFRSKAVVCATRQRGRISDASVKHMHTQMPSMRAGIMSRCMAKHTWRMIGRNRAHTHACISFFPSASFELPFAAALGTLICVC